MNPSSTLTAIALPSSLRPAQAPVFDLAPKGSKDSQVHREVPRTAESVAGTSAKPKMKLVRDSFTMPHVDFALIAALKDRALGFRRPTKKSELLRAGLQVLVQLNDQQLKLALESLSPLKAGRPTNKAT